MSDTISIQGKQETCLAHSQWLMQFSTIVDTVQCSYQNDKSIGTAKWKPTLLKGTFPIQMNKTSCLARHVGMNVHTSHRYRNWGTDTGCMYLPNTFELLLHCEPSKKHILYCSHIVLVIKIHGNMVVTSLFLTIKVICASLY